MTQRTQLIIARHGNTFAPGEVVRRVGTTDLPLVAKGLQQGKTLGAFLRKKKLIPNIIYTSTLKRTIQTAEQAQQTMGTHLPLNPLHLFDEIDYGPDENQPEAIVIQRIGHSQLNAWETHAAVPNGWRVDPDVIIHNWKTFSDRVLELHCGQTVMVVTSNGTGRFAPYLTGDFGTFASENPIKLATGAYGLFQYNCSKAVWDCKDWNIKP